jgi:glutamine synthetase type III
MALATQSVEIVRRFCEKVSESSTFSLELLRLIEQTVDSLKALCESFDADTRLAHQFVEHIRAGKLTRAIDPDKVMCEQVRSSRVVIGKVMDRLTHGRQAALEDHELSDEHRESIVNAYDGALGSAEDLREGMDDLAAAIESHDAELIRVIGPFPTIDDLIESLDA